MLPTELKQVILWLMQNVFFGTYPKEWNKQILYTIAKEGHSIDEPKLRGIAIAPFYVDYMTLYLINDLLHGIYQILSKPDFAQGKDVCYKYSC